MSGDPPRGPSGADRSGSDSPWSRESAGEIEVSWKTPDGPPARPAAGWVPADRSGESAVSGGAAGRRPDGVIAGGRTDDMIAGGRGDDVVEGGRADDSESWFARQEAAVGRLAGRFRRDGADRGRLLWFGVAGGGALLVGIVLILVLAGTGVLGPSQPDPGPIGDAGSEPSRPPLAEICPPVDGSPPAGEELPVPDGARISDVDSGISYAQLGAPWVWWDRGTWSDGTLGVEFREGYYFVTERYSRGAYLASVLSGKVPATVGDSLSLNLECAGRQVAEDVRNSYYPRPNQKEQDRSEQTTVGGRQAWVSTFHLAFQAEGLKARGETVAVVLIDVGKPEAAVLYLSVPDTHIQHVPEIQKIIDSVRPT